MILKNFRINAFTSRKLLGNPACVVPLKKWLSDEILLKIAKKNNVSETAFFINENSKFSIRWFTPDIEMDLCGHATLAAAHCINKHLNLNFETILFNSNIGKLSVNILNDLYQLDFPKREPIESELPEEIYNSLSIKPDKVLKSRDYVLVYNNIDDVIDIKINRNIFDKINIDPGGFILTNNLCKEQISRLKKMNLLKYFEKIYTSEEYGIEKPDMKLFSYIITEIGCQKKDLVIIDKNEPIKNGDIGAFLINNSEGTIKFLKNIQGKQYLVPANKNYEKIPVNENIQPIGKVVSLIRDM